MLMQDLRNIEDNLTSEQIQGLLLKVLLKIVTVIPNMKIKKGKLTIVLNLLVMASAENKTVNRICTDRNVPLTGVTVRNTIKLMFQNIKELEKVLNKLIRATLHKKLKRTRPIVSTDIILIGYYGKEESDPKEIRKGQKKNGTNSFHGYATVYVNLEGQRYTIAITYVWANDLMIDIVKRLNRYVRLACVKPSLWLLDRGYYGVDVIKWFQQHKKKFIMPGVWSGRKPSHIKGASGTNVYKAWTKSGRDRYTINKRRSKSSVTVDMAVVITYPDGAGQWQNPKIRLYVSYGFSTRKVRDIHMLYKNRFAIETSYRQMNQSRLRTTSKSPILRYFAVGLSFLMRNLWILIHFTLLYKPRKGPGGRIFCLDKLPFITMITWLRDILATKFPLHAKIAI